MVKSCVSMLPKLMFSFSIFIVNLPRVGQETYLLNPQGLDGVAAGTFDEDRNLSREGTTIWKSLHPGVAIL